MNARREVRAVTKDPWETHESVRCNTVAQFKPVTTEMQTVFTGSPGDVSAGVCTLKDCL